MKDELTVTFRFRRGEDVLIVPLKLKARVLARCDRAEGLQDYRVVYWSEGKRCDEWLYEHELSDIRNGQ